MSRIMRRKTAATVSMYLAYLIILAHAVIPHHHHHEAEVCIQPVEQTHHHCSHDESASEHTAHEDCKLSQSVLLPPDNQKEHKIILPLTDQVIMDVRVSDEPVLSEYSTPDLSIDDINSYQFFIVRAHILRAPPVA